MQKLEVERIFLASIQVAMIITADASIRHAIGSIKPVDSGTKDGGNSGLNIRNRPGDASIELIVESNQIVTMKTRIDSLSDAFGFLLQGLQYIEGSLMRKYQRCEAQLSSPELKALMEDYGLNCHNNELKIDRIFSYLMKDKTSRRNEIFEKMTAETELMLGSATSPHLKDILFIGCVESLISYKISTYRTAYLFAAELEMDTPGELIQQILESEYASRKALADLAIREFNKTQILSGVAD